jgi:hypothetical protein
VQGGRRRLLKEKLNDINLYSDRDWT